MTGTTANTDHELLIKVAEGDEKAFRLLFETYRDRLFHFLNNFIHSEQVAEELVLDVFMKIWLGRDLLSQVEDFRAFLYRIARNKAIDFFRSSAKNEKLKQGLAYHLGLEQHDSADAVLRIKEYEQHLREAVALLTPQRRQAFTLSREHQQTHEEIAQAMNISRHTVNSHITEAQRFIRQYLAKNLDIALILVLFHGK